MCPRKNLTNLLHNQAGVTLVEVMLAVFLSSVLMVLLLGVNTASQKGFFTWQREQAFQNHALRVQKKVDKTLKNVRSIEFAGSDSLVYFGRDGVRHRIWARDSILLLDTTNIGDVLKVSGLQFDRGDTVKEPGSALSDSARKVFPYVGYQITVYEKKLRRDIIGGNRVWP
jgi:hypothetical protein